MLTVYQASLRLLFELNFFSVPLTFLIPNCKKLSLNLSAAILKSVVPINFDIDQYLDSLRLTISD